MSTGQIFAMALIFVSAASFAQDDAEVEAFNDTWRKYQEAMDTADSEQQIITARDVLTAGRGVLNESDERLPLLMINLGNALTDGRRYDEAQEVLLEALALSESIHGEDSPELVPVLGYLADSYEKSDGSERRHYYYKALKLVKKSSGVDSHDYAALALRAGISLYGTDHSKSGERYVKTAHDYFLNAFGNEQFEAGLAAFYLGKYAYTKRKFILASRYLTGALAAFQEDAPQSVKFQMHTRALLVEVLENRGRSSEATEHCLAIGRLSKLRGTQNYEPLFRQAPQYPSTMLARGQQGFVDLSFTVDELGFVRNVAVIDTGPDDSGFEEAARKAVERFRYAPQFKDGIAIAVDGVKTRISFELEY